VQLSGYGCKDFIHFLHEEIDFELYYKRGRIMYKRIMAYAFAVLISTN